MQNLIARAGHHAPSRMGRGIPSHMVGTNDWDLWHPLGLILLALLVTLIILMILNLRKAPTVAPASAAGASKGDPLHVAKMRYAKGELSRDQYNSLVEELTPNED